VVHETICKKRGRHSVGVHRQFFRDQGIKANCQSAVFISQVGASGYLPLAFRLYLPRGWLERASPRQLAEIPSQERQPKSKDLVARELLAELFAEGKRPAEVVLSNGFADALDLAEYLELVNLPRSTRATEIQRATEGRDWLRERLGLDHFEGRFWLGWHRHAAAVLAAYGFAKRSPDFTRL
jgi:SRSO17 transposase